MRAWLLAGVGALAAVLAATTAARADGAPTVAPTVATDILPVQSIVAAVMAGVGEPGVILPPGADPHAYALRPSDAKLLAAADLVVWVGTSLTGWLAAPIEALASRAVKLELDDAPGIATLPARADDGFETHDPAPDRDPERDHDDAGDGAPRDGHLWLDPANAAAAARDVAAALGRLDAANAATYTANAERFASETAALATEVRDSLAPVRGKPFLLFHDAYRYFEHAFDLPAIGSVALQDGVEPGPARVHAIRQKVAAGGVVCAFAEPEFSPKLLATITEGSDVATGTLDHLGATLAPGPARGPALYPALIRGLAAAFVGCLSGTS